MKPQQTFELALQHHHAGRLAEAERLYRQVLDVAPRHAEAWHQLGVLAQQVRKYGLAAQLIGEAVAISPHNPAALSHLGEAYRALGRREEAIVAFRRALALQPDHVETYSNLGVALTDQGRLEEAMAVYRRVIQIAPELAVGYNNLGVALKKHGRWEEAIAQYRQALQLQPHYPEACYNLGNALKENGQLDEAAATYVRALELQPESVATYNNLGLTLVSLGRYEEAITTYRRAIETQPGDARTYNNLGNAWRECGQLDEAANAFDHALKIKPEYGKAQSNLGNVLRDQGRMEEALAAYRRAMELQPEDPSALSNVIYALQFHPDCEPAGIAREQKRWHQQFAEPRKPFIRPHPNDRNPGRRLRIGYVSSEFREHVTGRNLAPLFRCHDHRDFEILCYSGVLRPDPLTEELRREAEHWRDVASLTEETLAEVIREDGVDILVDLAQHMSGNRLPVFARQPAPVQVSFVGYPASTGLEAIGYRISDRHVEMMNAGPDNPFYCSASDKGREQVFLIDSFWCYDPCGLEVAVNDLPARKNRFVTFGCLNNFCKISEPVLRLWARVLRESKDSRIVFLSAAGSHRAGVRKFLEQEGIDPPRVEFVETRPRRAYLEYYHRVDIVLDPFPYNGHSTSLDALWMGVPVVSLAGMAPVSRGGLSILTNLGLPEWVAFAEEDYVRRAVNLAGDVPGLTELRATLRARMETSPLMDARGFTRQIEKAYRTMWRHWARA